MTQMGRAITRLVLVPLGCLLALAAAAAILVTLGLERATHALRDGGQPGQLETLFEIAMAMPRLARAMSLVPALMLVIVGEVARIRSLTYYVIGGGIALAILPFVGLSSVFGNTPAGQGTLDAGALWQVFATAGFAGGLVYWLIAGRRA